jgi:hypothetical protein
VLKYEIKEAEKQKLKPRSQTKRFEASSSHLLDLVVNILIKMEFCAKN